MYWRYLMEEHALALSHLCDPFMVIGKKDIPNCSIFHYGYNSDKFELIEILRPEVI